MRLLVGLTLLFVAACRGPAWGSATGLLLIPTADVLPKGDLDINPILNFGADPQTNNYFLGTEFGLTLGGYFPNSEGEPFITVQLDFVTPFGVRPR